MLPSYASHLHPKPRVDRFHTNDFTVPEANLYAHGLIIARVRAILNETGQTPVLVRKNYYWQLEDTWLMLCQLIPCSEMCCRLLKIYN